MASSAGSPQTDLCSVVKQGLEDGICRERLRSNEDLYCMQIELMFADTGR
jgi:hypothetical protein